MRRPKTQERAWFAVLIVALSASVSHAQDRDRPGYRKLRYEEHWSLVCAPEAKTQPLDFLKCIQLSPTGWLWMTVGGEGRLRYDYTNNPTWGSDPQDQGSLFLQRYSLLGDLHVGPHVRAFLQLFSALEHGQSGEPGPVDENQLAFLQGFVDLTAEFAEVRGFVRLGRYQLTYGSGRLVDVRAGPNVPRTFNGGQVFVIAAGAWRVDAIAVRPTLTKPGVFDDDIDHTQDLWGVYAVRKPEELPTAVDLYYLGYHNDSSTYQQGEGSETRHSLGLRLWGVRDNWDWNWEFIGQFGKFGSGTIGAWSVASDSGHTWTEFPWTPRLGLSANVASGDKKAAYDNLETFNPLFPRGNYFSELALLGPRNFFNVHPFLSASPLKNIDVTADVDFFWRLEKADGVYSPGGGLLRAGSSADARYVATDVSLNVSWSINVYCYLSVVYSHSFPGPFIADTGPADAIDFVEVTLGAVF